VHLEGARKPAIIPVTGLSPRPGDDAMARGHSLDLRWNALLNEFP